MAEHYFPLSALRRAGTAPAAPRPPLSPIAALDGALLDRHQRPLHDLRISVTDRCNFRCSYCMPKEVFDRSYKFLPQPSLLSFEEITRTARIFVALGVHKLRLTGGEPLLRKNLEVLVAHAGRAAHAGRRAAGHHLTTNASLLARKAQALKDAGLQRVTVSLDALDDAVFRRMNDVDFPVAEVLRGIDAAQRAGPGADQGQHGRQARHQRRIRSCRWRAISAAAARCCASSNTWTSARPTAGAWTRCCRLRR